MQNSLINNGFWQRRLWQQKVFMVFGLPSDLGEFENARAWDQFQIWKNPSSGLEIRWCDHHFACDSLVSVFLSVKKNWFAATLPPYFSCLIGGFNHFMSLKIADHLSWRDLVHVWFLVTVDLVSPQTWGSLKMLKTTCSYKKEADKRIPQLPKFASTFVYWASCVTFLQYFL